MATYVSKLWADRQSAYPNRRTLSWIDPDTQQEKTLTVTVTREEGTVTVEGDPFAALVMNGLEERISNAFATCDNILVSTNSPTAADGKNNDMFVKYSTGGGSTTITNLYIKISGAWVEVSTGGGGGSSTLAGLTDVTISSPTNGQALVYDSTSSKWVNGAGQASATRKIYVGTCSTAGATAQKEVTIPSAQGFSLEVGAVINVKFTYNNSAYNVTISVNGGTAYPIWYAGGVYTNNVTNVAGRKDTNMFYVFDGSYWVWQGFGQYMSYTTMTDALAEAGTATTVCTIQPTVLKHAIDYHAPSAVRTELTQAQYDNLSSAEKNNGTMYFITDAPSNPVDYSTSEKVIGTWIDGSTLYERTFFYEFSDISGGTQSQSVINGRFDLPHIDYDNMWIEQAFLINDVPNSTLTIKSMPLPISASSGSYIRIQIQKTTSNEGYPFIYIDINYNTSAIYDNRIAIHFGFVVRYTKE